MVMGNSKNLRVFNVANLLKLQKMMLAKYTCFTILLAMLMCHVSGVGKMSHSMVHHMRHNYPGPPNTKAL